MAVQWDERKFHLDRLTSSLLPQTTEKKKFWEKGRWGVEFQIRKASLSGGARAPKTVSVKREIDRSNPTRRLVPVAMLKW